MRKSFLILSVLLGLGVSFAQQQRSTISNARAAYVKADKKLNEVYKQLRTMHKSDTIFIKNLRNAQRAWLKFRDTEFKMNFPESKGPNVMRTLTDAQAEYLTNLTEERTKELWQILDPTSLDLVAYYPFNGNANDESGNNNNGTVGGTSLTSDRFGNPNSAYLFNPCSSIIIPDMLSPDCAAFTITAWVKQNVKEYYDHMIVFHGAIKGEAALNIVNGKLGFGINLQVPGTSNTTQIWYSATIVDTLKANTYYFLVGRYTKGHKVELFINGTFVASKSVPNLNMVTDPTRSHSAIGIHTQATFTQSYCWNGVIDDVRIYSRSITDQEVQVLYHEGGWTGNKFK
jgi:uncharacterized protein YecT (DUF1311 family)